MNEIEVSDMPEDYTFEAPQIKAGGEEMRDTQLVDVVAKAYAPKIMIYGCGGFGVNVIRKLPKTLAGHNNIGYRIFDTSMANVHKEPMPSVVEPIMVGEDGRGKLRGCDVGPLAQRVEQLVFTDNYESDIDVIICSLSGGTGSVVGPLLAKAMMKQDKPVIIFCVADGSSVADCINSINTIKTLELYGKDGYLNMVLFDNMKAGFKAVDEAILKQIMLFVEATDLDNVKWLDKSDITIAMRPFIHKMLSNAKGLFMTKIFINGIAPEFDVCYGNEVVPYCHSILQVNDSDAKPENDIMSSVSYHGRWVAGNGIPITIQFGLPIPESFNKTYSDTLKKGQAASAMSVKQSTVLTPEGSEQDSFGIIF